MGRRSTDPDLDLFGPSLDELLSSGDQSLGPHDTALQREVQEDIRDPTTDVVAADLPGHNQPEKRNGHVVDWVTVDSITGERTLHEMDPTGPMSEHDRRQHKATEEFAHRRSGVDYDRHTYGDDSEQKSPFRSLLDL